MSTAFYIHSENNARIVGTRTMRAYQQKAFTWAIPPHEFLEIAKNQPVIQDEYGTKYPFIVFIDDVVTPCPIHELDTGQAD